MLRTQVAQASTGTLDRSIPPKRVFRNLDLNRTIWKNLPNWSPEDERLYVDRLYYRQTAKRITPAHRIPFRSLGDAVGLGYRACLACKPASGTTLAAA